MSEDYFFCHKAREAGIQSFFLPAVQLQHVGVHVYEGDFIRSLGLVYENEKL
jgi:GT2 family glycosyltransferase